jgi:hypothetical protein
MVREMRAAEDRDLHIDGGQGTVSDGAADSASKGESAV